MTVKPKILDLSCARLIDMALLDIQTHLTGKLAWLDYAFGKIERQHDKDGNIYPAIYQGNNEYLNLLPDSSIGNYSYFEIEDGQNVEFANDTANNHRFTANFGLVFFFDYRDVYQDSEYRTIENIKYDIIEVLTNARLNTCSINVEQVYERAPNIYTGFSHEEIKREFVKRPYGVLKIAGELRYWQGC